MSKTKEKAFTLAEVLITIAIIGIVAAVTIPTVINKYKTAVASTRLKKFYSLMSQAIELSKLDNGDVANWTKEANDLKDEDGEYDYEANSEACYKFFMTYLIPYMKYNKITKTPEKMSINEEIQIVLADGSTIDAHNGACIDISYDVNGKKAPNKYGYDKFPFGICVNNNIIGGKNFGALFYKHSFCPNRKQALEQCKLHPFYCAALLQFDNWEFKSDYPYKL